jgi:3-hydroxyisobutyrate dehydrogenase-like beta-hydroxyacid dehydrogenase
LPELSSQTVGFIGLGLMGRPMALHLRRAGARVVAWNRSAEPLTALAAEGIVAARSAREVASEATIVVLMLADTAAVQAVLEGERGLLAGLRPGSLVVDMGTSAVAATRQFAEWVRAAGGEFVDAPVSGGQVGAEQASLTIMAGGSEAAVRRAAPLLRCLGSRHTHVGETGAGQVAKAANQIIVGLTIGAVAEALALAQRAGVDPARVREALVGGFADSRILELHGQRMIEGNYTPGGKVSTQRKDLQQALEFAESLGLSLPVTALTRDLYDQLIARGDAGLDHSALYRLLEADLKK